ncbi:MAG: hypothetical protein Q9219_005023 [cf. Caloplaca sp. 3 TL-2023]
MESPIPPDPYKALDVAKDASLATIRTAHRKLVLKTHPDKVQGDEELKKKRAEEFHQIQQAYEILCDDARRKAYDDRVKLATLRAEVMAERGGSRYMPEVRPMHGRSPSIEVRGGRVYEERAPRRAWDDHEDDFFSYKPRDPRSKYEDSYDLPSLRKSSIRLQEEKRRVQDIDEEREREREKLRWERGSAKAEKKSVFAERTRQRDKERRKDHDSKYRGAYVEDASETSSDSSNSYVPYHPRKREEVRRKDREELPRRTSKRATEEGYFDSKTHIYTVQDYIRQSREPEPEPRESREPRRPAIFKGGSTREIRPTPSPPATPRITGRGHARRETSPPPKSAARNRRVTEIVDPPEARRPSMPLASSDPKGLRPSATPTHRSKPAPRASTLEYMGEARQPGIRRAETMPMNRTHSEAHHVSRSSRTKEIDPGYSSPETPPGPSPKVKSTIFVVEEDEVAPTRAYNTVYVTPEDKGRRERDLSPKGRKSSDRPSMSGRSGTSARLPANRSTSYAPDADDFRAPRPKRAETAYASPLSSRQAPNQNSRQFFGEIPQTEEPYKIVHQSPKIGPQDIRYGKYDRRSSEDSRDWAPGSEFDSRNRPSYGRSTSRVY